MNIVDLNKINSLCRVIVNKKKKANSPALLEINLISSALLIAPHYDDEIIGCSGLFTNLAKSHTPITIQYLSNGDRGNVSLRPDNALPAKRKEEARAALQLLGASHAVCRFAEMPDMGVCSNKKIQEEIAELISNDGVSHIFINSHLDHHPDHRAAVTILYHTLKSVGQKRLSKVKIVMYEIYGPLPVNRFIDITGCVEIKRKAIQSHASQMLLYPYDEYILGLNKFRGLLSAKLGDREVRYAEGYLELTVKEFCSLWRKGK
ncbi:MAG: hypothetical protein GX556_08665 [Fibrobacter sp.]|nr:hypothetical protein [Fibrobacter sp.]